MIRAVPVALMILVAPVSASGATGTSQPVSGTAVAMVASRNGGEVDLLVLWRGAPGWFLGAGGHGGSGGGTVSTYSASERYGDVQIDMEVNFETHVATVAGMRVPLGQNNVVLVDHVGSQQGPAVVRTLTIDGALPASYPDLRPLIARSADLAAFVQCGEPMPTEALHLLDDTNCRAIEGKPPISRDELGVRMALSLYSHLVAAMDHARVAAMFAPDGEVVNPGQAPIRGPAAIEAFLRTFADYKVLQHDMVATSTTVNAAQATQLGTYHQRVRTPAGQVVEVSGQFRAEWVRDDSGMWHIIRMGTSPKA